MQSTLSPPRPRASARSRALEADASGLELHLPRLLSVARRILGSDDLAWDAIQEALMCLWHEEEEPRDLRGWLVRTVVHRSLHQVRSLERRRRHELCAWRDRASRDDTDPAQLAERRALAACVARAIAELPPEFREPLRLREIDGCDYGAIAELLGLPIGTVRSRLHRAKRMLRVALAELVHAPERCAICTDVARAAR